MKASLLTIIACAALAVAGCGSSSSSSSESTGATETTSAANKTKPTVEVPKGAPPKKLVVKEIEKGSGEEA